ncbi:MAG: gluconokinase [Chloroflexi bacterium]|nr:gluconokinase [Chloroflexota bacterium]
MTPIPPYVLALDVGSTSIRARLYDSHARLIEGVGHEIRRTASSSGLEDPEALRQTCETVISETLKEAGPACSDIAAVGMACFVGNVVGIDASGNAVTPLYTYAHSGSGPEVEQIKQIVDADAIHEATGAPLHTSYQAPRLLWIKNHRPDEYARVTKWIDLGAYLYHHWFDSIEIPCGYSVASWSGMLDRNSLGWHQPLIDAIGLDASTLPTLANYSESVHGLADPYRSEWSELANVPFYFAVGDGAGANIGSGRCTQDTAVLTVGTTGAMRAIVRMEDSPIPPGLWAYCIDREFSLLGGAVTDGGSMLDWLHQTLRLTGERITDVELATVEPDGHGLTVLPFLRGERSPGWASDASATWQGITASTSPADMARAAIEAISFRFALISRLLDQSGTEFTEIMAGGAAILKLPTWLQIVADATGKTVVAAPERGTTARGVAVLALNALGVMKSLDVPPASGERVEYHPDSGAHATYQSAIERQQDLYARLIGK